MKNSKKVPSIQQRIAALRELFPVLPLREPRQLGFTSGPRVIPWVQYYVSGGNLDEADRMAALLGTSEPIIYAQFDAFEELQRTSSLLKTREALEGLPSLERVFEFEQFAEHADADEPTAIWWTLNLPMLNPALDTAVFSIQLGNQGGAEDFWWRAKKAAGVWTLEAVAPPR